MLLMIAWSIALSIIWELFTILSVIYIALGSAIGWLFVTKRETKDDKKHLFYYLVSSLPLGHICYLNFFGDLVVYRSRHACVFPLLRGSSCLDSPEDSIDYSMLFDNISCNGKINNNCETELPLMSAIQVAIVATTPWDSYLIRRRFGKIIAQPFSNSERADTIKSRGNVSMSIRAHLNLVTPIC